MTKPLAVKSETWRGGWSMALPRLPEEHDRPLVPGDLLFVGPPGRGVGERVLG